MFGHKRSTDFKQAVDKFLDVRKEPIRRLRYLLTAAERLSKKATKALFEQHYYVAYQVFHDAFTALEPSVKARGGRIRPGDSSNQDFFEVLVPSLEKILAYLPNLVYLRWQANSIGVVLSKFLHPGSSLKVRVAGMDLLMLWVQGLRENVTPFAEQLFASAVPNILPEGGSFPQSASSDNSWVSGPELSMSLDGSTGQEGTSDVSNLEVLETFLSSLTSNCCSLVWHVDAISRNGFDFLFHLLKKHYLFVFFREARLHNGPYDGGASMVACQQPSVGTRHCQGTCDMLIRWLLSWLWEWQESNNSVVVAAATAQQTVVASTASSSSVARDHPATPSKRVGSSSVGDTPDHHHPHRQNSATTSGSGQLSKERLQWDGLVRRICDILYGSRENVVLIHEILRQVYKLPAKFNTTIDKATDLILAWAQSPDQLPPFIQGMSGHGTIVGGAGAAGQPRRPRSSSDAMLQVKSAKIAHIATATVSCGFVPNMNLFISSTSHVFLSAAIDEDSMDERTAVCMQVLNLYHTLLHHRSFSTEICVHLHTTLLKVIDHVLRNQMVANISIQVVDVLLSTLFLVMIQASLTVKTPQSMWNDTLCMLSQLSHHPPVVEQWSTVLDTLTKMLSQKVYNLALGTGETMGGSDQRGKARVKNQRRQDASGQLLSSEDARSQQQHGSVQSSRSYGSLADMPSQASVRMPAATPAPTSQNLATDTGKLPLFPLVSPKADMDSPMSTDSDHSKRLANPDSPCSLAGDPAERAERERHFSALSWIRRDRAMASSCLQTESGSTESLASGGRRRSSVSGDRHSVCSPVIEDQALTTRQDAVLCASHSTPAGAEERGSRASTVGCEGDDELTMTPFRSQAHRQKHRTSLDSAVSCDSAAPEKSMSVPHIVHITTTPFTLSTLAPTVEQLSQAASQPDLLEDSVPKEDLRSHSPSEPLMPDLEVLLGGSLPGWTSTSAAVLFQRMLGLLGNPNHFKSPALHEAALKCLTSVWRDLLKIYNRQGDVVDADAECQYDPPLLMFAPWVLQTYDLPDVFQAGKLRAMQLLCHMTIVRHDHPVPKEHLSHFYHRLYNGLTSGNEDMVDCIIIHSHYLFSYNLAGSLCLINVYLKAVESIFQSTATTDSGGTAVGASGQKAVPGPTKRPAEAALRTLGALLNKDYLYPKMSISLLGAGPGMEVSMMKVKDAIIKLLLNVASSHESESIPLKARCLAISMIGQYIYSELVHHRRSSSRCVQAIYTLMNAIGNVRPEIALATIDMLFLLTEVPSRIPSNTAKTILESLCSCASYLLTDDMTQLPPATMKRRQVVLGRMLPCIVKWTMSLTADPLMAYEVQSQSQSSSLLKIVFQILHKAGSHLRPEDLLAARRRTSTFDESYLADPKPPRLSALSSDLLAVCLTARFALEHLVSFLDHFPFAAGAACLSSTITESDDHERYAASPDLVDGVFNAPNVLFFSCNDSTIVSVSEMEDTDILADVSDPDGEPLRTGALTTRIIVRNMTGKWAWDATSLYGKATDENPGVCSSLKDLSGTPLVRESSEECMSSGCTSSTSLATSCSSIFRQHLLSQSSIMPGIALENVSENMAMFRPPDCQSVGVPSCQSFASPDGDNLNELLDYLSTTSRECLPTPDCWLSQPHGCEHVLPHSTQNSMIHTISSQHSREQMYLDQLKGVASAPCQPTPYKPPSSIFHHGRSLLHNLGFFNKEKQNTFRLLDKNDKLRRELKHLDSRPFRETYKIGVVYVAPGQDDKQTILSNTKGSAAFEEFVAAMTWEVDLSTHPSFMGGLQRNATTGATAPYFCTSMREAVFHVSTRMPTLEETGVISKLRHIGNDEVQIIWSEHDRDWRRDIIRTEFGDVMIVLYPMKNGLCRVQILTKTGSKLPHFGPLFDGAVVDRASLPGLVRATAINANRAKRSELQFYQMHYEERARYIANLSRNCEKHVSLEEFCAEVVQPAQPDEFSPAHCRMPDAWLDERSDSLTVPDPVIHHIQPRSRAGTQPMSVDHMIGSTADVPLQVLRRDRNTTIDECAEEVFA